MHLSKVNQLYITDVVSKTFYSTITSATGSHSARPREERHDITVGGTKGQTSYLGPALTLQHCSFHFLWAYLLLLVDAGFVLGEREVLLQYISQCSHESVQVVFHLTDLLLRFLQNTEEPHHHTRGLL